MRRTCTRWLILLVLGFTFTGVEVARAGTGFYFGLGGSHASSDINDALVGRFEEVDFSLDFGDSSGFNARFGWRFADLLAVELNYDNLSGFERSEGFEVLGIPVGATGDLSVSTLMVDAKLIPLDIGPVELRLFGGLGMMWAELETTISTGAFGGAAAVSADDSLPCGELGMGVGVWLGDAFTLGVEGSYVASAGDFAGQDYGIGYTLVTVGLDYNF